MRITADVIDEEPCSSFWASEQVPAKNPKKLKVVVRSCLKGKDDKPYHVIFDKMLRKFQELYVSDFTVRTDVKNTAEEVAQYYKQRKQVNLSMDGNPVKLEESSKTVETKKLSKEGNSVNLPMDGNPDDLAGSSKSISEVATETPSAWLLQYLDEMKKEITREVTQSVMQELIGVYDSITDTNDTVAEMGEVVHKGVYCDHCDSQIHGIRYKCGNCIDYDLCQLCENIPNVHDKNHIFLKIRSPVPTPAKTKRRRKKMVKLISHTDMACDHPFLNMGRPKERLKMDAEFLCDLTISDGAVVKPGVTFMKSWKVINSGLKPWTRSTTVKLLWGSEDMKPHKNQVITPMLLPGEEGIVSVMFTSPKVAGHYQSYWGFHHNDQVFGHHIWCSIEVRENLEDASKDDLQGQASSESILEKSQEIQRDDKVIQFADALTAVQEVQERGEVVSRKLAPTSHTATPNNTPFDLTPPKSPEPQDSVVKEMRMNQEVGNIVSPPIQETPKSAGSPVIGHTNEESSGLISISSSDSDTEFVIIPMPKCFTLEDSVPLPETSDSIGAKSEKERSILLFDHQIHIDQVCLVPETTPSERVSQETGAPEVAESVCIQTTVEINNDEIIAESSEHAAVTTTELLVESVSEEDTTVCGNDQPVINNAVDDSVINVLEPKEKKENTLPNDTLPKWLISEEPPGPVAASRQEEKIIQVLPEGLVTGALSAAATVYNTARAVISSIQVKSDQNSDVAETNPSNNPSPGAQSVNIPAMDPMTQLIEMGFCNRSRNEQLLRKHSGDVTLAVAELVNMNDNDWYSSRHAPEHFAFD